jgi:hypothetical protein
VDGEVRPQRGRHIVRLPGGERAFLD